MRTAAPAVLVVARAMAERVGPYAFDPCPYSADVLQAQVLLASGLYGRLVTTVHKFPIFPADGMRGAKVMKRLHPSAGKWAELQVVAADNDADAAVAHFSACTDEFMALVDVLHIRYVGVRHRNKHMVQGQWTVGGVSMLVRGVGGLAGGVRRWAGRWCRWACWWCRWPGR